MKHEHTHAGGHSAIFEAARARRPGIKGWERIISKLETAHGAGSIEGREVAPLAGLSLDAAVDMVVANAELELAKERLRIAARRSKLAQRSFWQTFVEQEAVDPDGKYSLNIAAGVVRESSPVMSRGDGPSGSLRKSIKGYCSLIKQAMASPLAACRMSEDHALPGWLSSLASSLVNTSSDDPADFFAPQLRSTLEEWLDKPYLAREFSESPVASEAPWFLRKAAQVLGLRHKDGDYFISSSGGRTNCKNMK